MIVDLTTNIRSEYTINDADILRIILIIERKTGITYNQMKNKTRKREIVIARQVAMYFIKLCDPNLSFKSIGEIFGDRDHSTVVHALSSVEDMYDTNKKFKTNMLGICAEIDPELLPKLGMRLKRCFNYQWEKRA